MVYFASDFHLGVDFDFSSRQRETMIVAWLKSIRDKATTIYLVGDIFDYWYEYKEVVPKGGIRLLGTLADLVDQGIDIHYFKGNHDMWLFDYFEKEIGLQIHDHYYQAVHSDRLFHITHGDGLGHGDQSYKMIKKVLRNKTAQALFAMLHPSIGLPLMKMMSRRSRSKEQKQGPDLDQNTIIEYADTLSKKSEIDYFIAGHRHHPKLQVLSNNKTLYCNLGDWMTHFTYAQWDGDTLKIEEYK